MGSAVEETPVVDESGEVLQEQPCVLHRRQAHRMELVGRLAGGIAHEFNNLLQAILGYGKLAIDGLSPDSQPYDDLQEVLVAAERATRLTRQLLGFSRRQSLQPSLVDPNKSVDELVKMVRPLIGEHIALEVDCGASLDPVWADPGELQQVLLNLCLNARDAMPSGGRLSIQTERVVLTEPFPDGQFGTAPGAYVTFVISDTGCGLSSEVRKHLFEPYFTTKGVGEGTGLGLAMVLGVLKDHHGAIAVTSELGKGASFRVYLPIAERIRERQSICGQVAVAGGRETILVAEDDALVRTLIERILCGAGYKVLTASDGEEALRVLRENAGSISLALLDAIMPRLNGYGVFERAHALHPDVKFVFCSGYDPGTYRSSMLAEKGLQLIEKPVNKEKLLHTIRQVLDAESPELLLV